MADGRWSMADGRWPMVDGRWSMVDGRWPMPVARWPMADGRWSIESDLDRDGSRVFSGIPCPSIIVHFSSVILET
jgi:hypothetical protein